MNPILTTIITCSITGVCSVIVAIITSSWFAKKMTKDDRIDELSKDIKDIKERQKTIEQTVTSWQKCDENLKEANVALLKDRFDYIGNKALEKGSITITDLNAITRLSIPYFKLDDEDRTGHNLLERVKELPLEKENYERRKDA